MPSELKERIKYSFFQPGHKPANTKHDGAVSIRRNTRTGIRYKWMRISENNWVMLHRYNYQEKHGPLPTEINLRCKDGNQLNCDPNNWEPNDRSVHLDKNLGRSEITDRYALRMLSLRDPDKRVYIANYMPELIELKRNQLKLRRIINESGNNPVEAS